MRFFSGVRGEGKKKITASQRFKDAQKKGPKIEKTQDEKYKEMIEAKIQKLTEDAMMGIKKGSGFQMPGTKKDDKPKELSKNAKMMMKLLAMAKLQKDAKKEKKAVQKILWEAKAKKRADYFAKVAVDEQEAAKKRAEEEAAAAAAAAATPTASSWWGVGSSSDDNNGW